MKKKINGSRISMSLIALITLLVILLVFIKENTANAVDTEDIKVDISNDPRVDIVLTAKETNIDLSTFEKDVNQKLQSQGINTSNINYQTVDRSILDMNSADASKIFSTWSTFPYNITSNWRYDSNGKYITSSVNEPYETGFIDEQTGNIHNLTIQSSIHSNEYIQPVGYILRMSKSTTDENRYNMYMLWVSGFDGYNRNQNVGSYSGSVISQVSGPKRFIVLFKVEGLILDYNVWKNYETSGTYSATALAPTMYNGTYCLGWPYHTPRNYGGFPDGTPLKIGQVAVNSGDSNLKSTVLGFGSVDCTGQADDFDLKITAEGSDFDIFYNNNLLFNVKDSSYFTGKYGFFEYSHVSPRFSNINAEIETYKSYKEVLTEPNWRENSNHIVVNIDDAVDDSLTGNGSAEVLSRTLTDNIHFIQWGTDANKAQTQEFIAKNDNKGLFTYNTNYSQAVSDTATYIKKLIEQQRGKQYVIMGEDTNIVVNPSELKTNAVSDDFPNGRWMIHHDYKYYDNNLGQSNQTETYKPDLMCNFDKPGKYNIYFDDKLKKEVYVHRLPVADFTIKIANKQLTLTSISYDLDKNEDVGYGKGIASEKWYYKKSTDTAWTEGKLTTFDNTQDYVIKLEVTDMQGATSSITKYVGEGAPVAYFNYGTTVFTKYQKLEVTNTSYDPLRMQ